MSVSELEELARIMRESVERIQQEFDEPDDDWIPVMGLVPQEGENVMLALDSRWLTDENTKDDLVKKVMIPAINGVGAKTVATVFSVWSAKVDPDVDLENFSASNSPDRQEAVLVSAMNSFTRKSWMIPITRFADSPPALGDWYELPDNSFSGRFVDGIQEALRDSSGQTDPDFMEYLSEQTTELSDDE